MFHGTAVPCVIPSQLGTESLGLDLHPNDVSCAYKGKAGLLIFDMYLY